ncbi:TPA: hypothetical protein JG951_003201 [Enterobacter hormaechei subsp. steigerwaltii]|nr:hypothetical protein [Enterobacter hormaechei subsp. steigerwaltii]
MANSLTEIFTSLLALPDLDRNVIASLLYQGDKRPLQTTTLRIRPGTLQLLQELCGRLGVSQSELMNMILEGSLRDIFLSFSSSAASIIDRFEVLMQAHKLPPTDIAQMLSPWNIRLSVLQDRERTVDYLSTSLLQELASWFYVSRDWLLGYDVPVVDTGQRIHQWPRSKEEFSTLISPSDINKNSDIIFWSNKNSPDHEYKNKTGILIKKKQSASGIIYHPVLSIIPARINKEQLNWIEQAVRTHDRTCPMRSVIINEGTAIALEQGTTLPAIIFRHLNAAN